MKEVDAYLLNVDDKRREDFLHLFNVVKENIPEGFELGFSYGMIGYDVPLSVYPDGYLNRKDEPVPFIGLAAQKRHIALYHMGIMGNKPLLEWFQKRYAEEMPTKLNMGKSCIRFTNSKKIPYDLIGELVTKMSMEEWIASYEKFVTNRNG
ncbi:DUF1801 domain-containing protein [Enterococcus sp. LJL128]|uniref:DUF1801 domain-containing protein n=1 Tax=Enterococcus sp. LJL51 TaxID=3416656 RepID=UPI003CF697DA